MSFLSRQLNYAVEFRAFTSGSENIMQVTIMPILDSLNNTLPHMIKMIFSLYDTGTIPTETVYIQNIHAHDLFRGTLLTDIEKSHFAFAFPNTTIPERHYCYKGSMDEVFSKLNTVKFPLTNHTLKGGYVYDDNRRTLIEEIDIELGLMPKVFRNTWNNCCLPCRNSFLSDYFIPKFIPIVDRPDFGFWSGIIYEGWVYSDDYLIDRSTRFNAGEWINWGHGFFHYTITDILGKEITKENCMFFTSGLAFIHIPYVRRYTFYTPILPDGTRRILSTRDLYTGTHDYRYENGSDIFDYQNIVSMFQTQWNDHILSLPSSPVSCEFYGSDMSEALNRLRSIDDDNIYVLYPTNEIPTIGDAVFKSVFPRYLKSI